MLVRLTGGLGNQLFQWAFGRSLSVKKQEPVQYVFERSCFDYELYKYDIEISQIDQILSAHNTYDEQTFRFHPEALSQPPGTYYRGYWQTEKYFDWHRIRKELRRKDKPSALTIGVGDIMARNPNSVFVHVRRGDYVKAAEYHGLLGIDYYTEAMDRVKHHVPEAKFYIFSDDMEWCRQNFSTDNNILGFTEPDKHDELYLMSRCSHAIIANSSFSWWGAWLGDASQISRIVVAPQKWFGPEANLDSSDVCPDRWTRI